ncbi:DinB family protein [Streptomyces hainanensis]|uniref:DinB-like domain-containing protein n=1 Tax=Streptomyces hainanensis TaxID=402648 RepID=A0A4R4TJE4_9ACTN|nr:DinB family protein [Streptomyces hainanensis]TDC76556.1 hypothetical protein E1283_09550 [Streptomyces hainanensis]
MAALLRECAEGWRRLLCDRGLDGRRVGTPLWSPLEHGCHVRDMCLLFHSGLDAMLGGNRIAPSERSEAGADPEAHGPRVLRRYREEEPRQVAAELGRAADALADRLASLTDDDWRHRAPGPADSRLTVDFFARHLLHDIAHGLAEIRRGDRSTAPRARRKRS